MAGATSYTVTVGPSGGTAHSLALGASAGATTQTLKVEGGESVPFTNAGTMRIDPGSGIFFKSTGDYTQTGGVTIADGALIANGGQVLLNGGVLRGHGSVSPAFVNAAEVQPGGSPGTLTVVGSYTQTAGGKLTIEVEGTTVSTQYDRLTVTGSPGTASLTGTLATVTGGGSAPSIGQTFPFLFAGSISGTFSPENTPGYDVQYGSMVVTLVANGQPSAVRILAFAATSTPRGMLIRWRTGSESGVLGFDLHREGAAASSS